MFKYTHIFLSAENKITASNTQISLYSLLWKFCVNTQFPEIFQRISHQWASGILWTSNGRLYEVQTWYRRPWKSKGRLMPTGPKHWEIKKLGEIAVFCTVKCCIFNILSGNAGYKCRHEKKKNILSTKAIDIF